jgi:hypothetical protein
MEVRYTAIHKFLGISKLADNVETQPFVELSELNATTKLTTNPEPFCFHLDRANALATQLLKGLFGTEQAGTPEERLDAQLEEVRANRQKQSKNGVFVIFEGSGDIESPDFKTRRDANEYAVCFDAYDKEEVRERFRPALHGILAAIGLSLPERADTQIEKVGDVSYLVESQSGKYIYSFTAKFGGAKLTLSSSLSKEGLEHAQERALAFPNEGTLAKVANLLIESQEIRTNELRAFIAAWSALEIFVTATFKAVYEERLYRLLSSNVPASIVPYIARLKSVMNDKHRLNDKFLVLASILDSVSAEADASVFRRLKSARDGLFHASETATERYPVEDTQKILRKYLDLHLGHRG